MEASSADGIKQTPVLIRIWDALVLVLVVFPLLTGGFWIEKPGYFFELSDLGVPVLLVSLLGWVLKAGLKLPLEQSRILSVGSVLFARWVALLERRAAAALWIAAALVGAGLSGVALIRHWGFQSNASDLGIFTNALWNLVHGNGYISSVKDGLNLFADHQSPIFWAFAPLFWIWPAPEALLIAQAFGLSSGGVAAFYLARAYFPRQPLHWSAGAIPLLFWAYFPIRNANHFDFHPEVLMLPLFLWGALGIFSLRTRDRLLGGLALLLALGAKESAGPVAAGLGLSWILGAAPQSARSFARRTGFALLIAGCAVFYFDLKVVPRFFGAEYAYNAQFAAFGGLSDILLAPFVQPDVFFSHLIGKARLKFLFFTLAPLAFLPVINPRAFVAALPGYLMLFLSAADRRVSLDFHYGIEPAVGLFLALPGAFATLSKTRFAQRGSGDWKLRLWVLFWAFGAFGRSELYRVRSYWPGEHERWLRREFLACISPDATIAATNALVPHLASRHWANYLTNLRLPSGLPVDCVIEDSSLSHWPISSATAAEILGKLPAEGFTETYSRGTVRVFQYSGSKDCLVCQPR